MRLCFVVDARSAIARNWVSYFVKNHEVHVISTYRCEPDSIPGATLYQVPIAFARLAGTRGGPAGKPNSMLRRATITMRSLDFASGGALRGWLAPLLIVNKVGRLRALFAEIRPDLIHAMRIPFEGIASSWCADHHRLLISSWGNDLTLRTGTLFADTLTRMALRRADAFHSDCERDLKLAIEWGLDSRKPSVLLPGAGGVQLSLFHPGACAGTRARLSIPHGSPVIINPRGIRNYVRNDTFFKSIPMVLRELPSAIFVCPAMSGEPEAEQWVRRLGLERSVRLLAAVRREEMADLFRAAEVTVSPTTHDGTPNTLLEAMASGCFPVAGDIESVREWIVTGSNGALCDPSNPAQFAEAIIAAARNPHMRAAAAEINQRLIAERAEYGRVMAAAEQFYGRLISPRTAGRASGA